MISQAFNAMFIMIMAKFVLNDVPHVLGFYDNPHSNIDPAIRNLISSLNNQGYSTIESCEGHLLITGRISNAYIRFEPGAIRDLADKRRVLEIIKQHTDTPIIRSSFDKVLFRGSIRERPTASPEDAFYLLEDLKKGRDGPGRSPEKILSMYDVEELEEMAKLSMFLRG